MNGRRHGGGWVIAAAVAVAAAAGGCGGGSSTMPTGGGGTAGTSASGRRRPCRCSTTARLHDLALTMSADDWQSIIDDSRGDEWRHASVTYDGVVVDDVGVRPAGESSRFAGNQKMSIRIKFDAFDGQRQVRRLQRRERQGRVRRRIDDARAAGVIRVRRVDAGAQGRARDADGQRRSRAACSRCARTGTRRRSREHFTQPFGPLYRLRPLLRAPIPTRTSGDDPASYVPHAVGAPHQTWRPRGDEVVPPFLKAIAATRRRSSSSSTSTICSRTCAAAEIVMTTDGLVGSTGASDHFQYYDPQSGKFFVLPWDPDNTFGSQGEMPNKSIYSKLGRNALTIVVRDRHRPARRVTRQEARRRRLPPCRWPWCRRRRTRSTTRSRTRPTPTRSRRSSNDTFDWSRDNIKDFAAQRYASIQQQLGM